MSRVLFVTHPEVNVDPGVPVPDWELTPRGRDRMRQFAEGPDARDLAAIWSSRERKAADAAAILAEHVGVPVRALEQLAENDRSTTGYLPPELFEPAVQAFFREPLLSHRGWETAAAAQQRIADAIETVLARSPEGDVAIVSHGGVGTLLLCHLKGTAIHRAEDQPGQGHWYAFDRDTRAVLHGWRPL
ncbi:MAG TPA: histidine phosphatase family protein [Solirubrobacteraceae bacterium]|nr:histidine phosphatase family protein [Solirubrobacteraceae bacterium]